MFGLGFSEILLCLVIALIVFGPEKLPELARLLGRTMGELRRTLDDIKLEVNAPIDDIRKEVRGELRSVMNEPTALPSPSP